MKFLKIISGIFFLFWSICILTNGALGEKVLKQEEKPVFGGTYRRPLQFMPKTLDPAFSTDIYAVTVIQQLFDGLVQFDKDLNVIPAIAKSWKISPDGLTYTFYLREGVKFHNGREVTAKDFVYSFTRIIDPETKSSSSDFFTKILGAKEFINNKTKEVKGLIALDKYTLQIIFSEPYAPFISILAMKGAKVVPKEEVEKSGINFGKSPIGTGPFRFVSMKEGEEIVLEANPDYFEGRPYLDKIIFKIFHGSPYEDIFRNFVEGTLEETRVPFKEFRDPSKLKNFYIVRKPILSLRFYGMQIKTKPFDNKKVRQAINFAINKEEIDREAFQGMDSHNGSNHPIGNARLFSCQNYLLLQSEARQRTSVASRLSWGERDSSHRVLVCPKSRDDSERVGNCKI